MAAVAADGREYEGSVFVDATGTAGPQGNCLPYGNGCAMCFRYLAISPRDDYLQVRNVHNLFCAGEKAGPLVGHTEEGGGA